MLQKIKRLSPTSLLQVVCSLAIFFSVASLTQAQVSGRKYNLAYSNGLLTLSAKQASLERILNGLADALGIYIIHPRDLNREITINLYDAPPIEALRRILKDQNYAVIYSASKPGEANAISELYILPKPIGHGTPGKSKRRRDREERTLARIRGYERTIQRLTDRLARTNSERTERRIENQIRSHERKIEKLQKQLGR
jgi:hypothetical protein